MMRKALNSLKLPQCPNIQFTFSEDVEELQTHVAEWYDQNRNEPFAVKAHLHFDINHFSSFFLFAIQRKIYAFHSDSIRNQEGKGANDVESYHLPLLINEMMLQQQQDVTSDGYINPENS